MSVIQDIKEEILLLLREVVGPEVELISDHLVPPPSPEYGDLSFGCFPLANVWGKKPQGVADDLAGVLAYRLTTRPSGGYVERVEAKGPYLNFWLSIDRLSAVTLEAIGRAGARYGTRSAGALSARLPADTFFETRLEGIRNILPGRSLTHQVTTLARGAARTVRRGVAAALPIRSAAPLVMVEVCSPNTHKEIHIGHLRNILLGRAVVTLRRALGEQVIASSYPGDAGAHVAKTLWALEKFHAGAAPAAEKGRFLGQVYAEASRYLEVHPAAKEEVAAVQRRLETGERRLVALWRRTRAWSLTEIKAVFSELGVPIRRFYFESEMEKPGKRLVAELLRRGIARHSAGATIIDLAAEGLGAFLILKSDGASLYATKDLALARRKFSDYPLDLSIHVVDARQTLYFKQLFAALHRIGFTKPLVHLPFEFVTLPEGAMSSRKGNVIAYEDFRDEMVVKARQETSKRHADWSQKKVEATSRAIALGAMAVGMLKVDNERKITFDMKEALAFNGFTGPYLQYTLARIRGIVKKTVRAPHTSDSAHYATAAERKLIMDLTRYPEVVESAALVYRPATLVEFLFELAKHFAEFYEQVPVLKASPPERAARRRLVEAVGATLESSFRLLGIPVLEEM